MGSMLLNILLNSWLSSTLVTHNAYIGIGVVDKNPPLCFAHGSQLPEYYNLY